MKREEPMPTTTLNPRKDVQRGEAEDQKTYVANARRVANELLKFAFNHRLRRSLSSAEKRLFRIERAIRKVGR